MCQFFASGGQSIGASASASVLPMNSQLISLSIDWFDFFAVQGTLKSSPAQFESINSLALSLLYGPTLTSIRDYWKSHSLDYMDLCCEVMSLLFNTLSSFVIAFLPRSKNLFNLMAAVTLEPKKIKSVSVSIFSPSTYLP